MPEGMSERLKGCIEKSGLGIKETARRLGVSRSTLYRWLDEIAPPNVTELAKICKMFNVSADYLIFGV